MEQKVAIIGAGGMASYHIAGYKKAGANIVGVVSRTLEKAKACAEANGIRDAYVSLDELMKKHSDLTAVSVITPNKFHKPITLDALNRGLHVYCEKPPALNAAETQEMADAAKKAGKTLMFGFNNRARPEVFAMKKYINDGTVGKINSAQAAWIRRNGIPGFGGWFTNKSMSGGGPVIDLIHMIDLALYFMDFPEPSYVLAEIYNDFMGNPAFKGPWGTANSEGAVLDVETACHAFLTFKSGQCLSIRNSWAEMNEREVVSVVFQGTKAGGKVERLFAVDGDDSTALDSCCLYTEENGNQVNRNIKVPFDETLGRIDSAANFIDAISGKAEPLNTAEQAVTLMKIVDAIYESALSKKPVEV